ncbi:MAG: potassium channel family protein [Acidimicrobiales bacterium]|jgi:voltage-gated potassium channel
MPAGGASTTDGSFVPYEELTPPQRRRLVFGATLHTIATVVAVVAIYFLMPMDRAVTVAAVLELIFGGLALFAVIAWQIRRIMRSEHPGVRAVEALAFALPVYVLLFASVYFLMAHAQSGAFGVNLSRIDAMYFSATVFSTVGFGNIAAASQAARTIVTVQMMLDLVVIGIVIRGVVSAVKIGRQRPVASGSPE